MFNPQPPAFSVRLLAQVYGGVCSFRSQEQQPATGRVFLVRFPSPGQASLFARVAARLCRVESLPAKAAVEFHAGLPGPVTVTIEVPISPASSPRFGFVYASAALAIGQVVTL